MGSVNLDNTGSGSAITLSSDGTSLLLDGTAVGGGSANAVATTTVPVAGQTNTGTLAIGNNVLTSVNANKSSNIGIGNGALELATDSRTTVAVGGSALKSNGTTAFGWQNTAIGVSAGLNVTGGYDQVFMGYNCGGAIASGTGNIVIGTEAYLNKTGTSFQYNVVIGHKAGWGATSGSNAPQGQILIGQRAGSSCQGGVIAIGDYAVVSGTLGGSSVAIGKSALRYGGNFRNVAIGESALLYADTTSQQNVGIGYYALYDLTSGDNNTGVGNDVLQNITTGSYNTCLGDSAGVNQTTPSSNTFIGKSSGQYVTTGGSNTILGRYNGNQNSLDIRTSSNNVVLSDGAGLPRAWIASSAGWYQSNNSASWSQTSDERIKENISSLGSSLSKILSLRPVEFDYKIKDKNHDIGFIAQEYVSVFPDQVTSNSKVSDEISELTGGEPVLSIEQNLVPYLVKAIQEQNTIIEELTARITALEGA